MMQQRWFPYFKRCKSSPYVPEEDVSAEGLVEHRALQAAPVLGPSGDPPAGLLGRPLLVGLGFCRNLGAWGWRSGFCRVQVGVLI